MKCELCKDEAVQVDSGDDNDLCVWCRSTVEQRAFDRWINGKGMAPEEAWAWAMNLSIKVSKAPAPATEKPE
jgi:hypothetical protein